jgi:hypothetical protein
MKNNLLLVFLLISLPICTFGQASSPATQSVYVELGGAGLPYSFNYDFRFDKTKIDSWGMRIGAGGYSLSRGTSFFSVPVQVSKLYGKNGHYFEAGAGFTFLGFKNNRQPYCISGTFDQVTGEYICNQFSESREVYDFILEIEGSPNVMGTLNFGYRRVPVDGGFMWRANLSPIFNGNGFWPLWVGVGIGYAF